MTIEHTQAYSRFNPEANRASGFTGRRQRAMDFASVSAYAIASLKEQYNLVKTGLASGLPRPEGFFSNGDTNPHTVIARSDAYESTIASYTVLSNFSFFEAYVNDALKEMIEFHGGRVEFIRRANALPPSALPSPLDKYDQEALKKLREDPKPGKELKYIKYSKVLMAAGYGFPAQLVSAFSTKSNNRGASALAEIVYRKMGNQEAGVQAGEILDVLSMALQMNIDEPIHYFDEDSNANVERSMKDVYEDIKTMRHSIAHGKPIKISLHKSIGAYKALGEIAKKIDTHLTTYFFVVDDWLPVSQPYSRRACALAEEGEKEGIGMLIDMIESQHKETRETALICLSRFGAQAGSKSLFGGKAQDVLTAWTSALSSGNPRVRKTAALNLKRYRYNAEQSLIPQIIKVLEEMIAIEVDEDTKKAAEKALQSLKQSLTGAYRLQQGVSKMGSPTEAKANGHSAAQRGKQHWLTSTYAKARGKSPERAARFETHSQIEVQPLYTPEDLEAGGFDYERDLGYPGEFPYTRGVQATMYRGRLWTMRQYAGFGDASESNRRYRYLLAQGQTGLSVAFDLPTQMGYDSDSPMADGEVGKVGVAISSLDDMENLLRDIPLDKASTSMTINATASVLLALYIAVARKQGVPETALNGTVQNDILKEYMARGTYIYPPAPSLRLITDLMAYCRDHVPNWNTISISGYHIREAGATAVQEVAFTIADALAYVQAALDAGLKVDEFAPRLAFFFNSHNDFLEEVAKFRAARRLWARLMQERFHPQDPRSLMLRFHTQTAGSTLTAQQPLNNIVRTTVQAMAAVLGGTQSLHTNSMDEALALPSEVAARTALRTQQILAYESGVASTIDPLAGSYYIESLTDEIEAGARQYLDKVEQLGGTLKALEGGFFQAEIQESAYRWQREVESKQRIIVGVNQFAVEEQPSADLLRVNERVQREQIARLQALRARRDNSFVAEQRAKLRRAASGRDNLMPYIIACVEALVTLGEICDTLREVFGEYQETVF